MKIGESKVRKEHHQALDEAFNRRLISYTTAAAAAGLGLLGLAPSAEAKIVFTSAHVVIGFNASYPLDVNHDGTTDFAIIDAPSANSSTVFNAMLVHEQPGNAVVGSRTYAGRECAAALIQGAQIGPNQDFKGEVMASSIYSPGGGQQRGHWVNVMDRYLGLKFEINGETHFGWARLNVRVKSVQAVTATLTGYAFETVPNKPITAGQTDDDPEGPAAGPESLSSAPKDSETGAGTLGALALGSAGLPVWRRLQPLADGRR